MSEFVIAQVGAFDFENYGDILFPYVFENNIKRYIDIKEVVLFAPTHGIMPFSKERQVYSVTELEKIHKDKNFDAIIVGGGDLAHFRKILVSLPALSDKPVLYDVLYMWIIPCIIAWKYDITLIWNSPGVPIRITKPEEKVMEQLLTAVKYISVRDELSKNNMGVVSEHLNVRVVPDTVLSICELISKEELEKTFKTTSVYTEDRYIVFHANRTFSDEDIEKCAAALLEIKKKYEYKIILMPIGYALDDMQTLSKIESIAPEEFILVEDKLSQFEMLSVIANANCYIGASLHGCITATAYDVKNIVYSYNNYNKIEGFLKLIGKTDVIIYKAEELNEKFDEVMKSNLPDIAKALSDIDSHFKSIAEIIADRDKDSKNETNKKIEPVEFAEYIYANSQNEIELDRYINETELKDKHISNLNGIINEKNMEIHGLHQKINDKTGIIADKDVHINNITSALENSASRIKELESELEKVSSNYAQILNSKSWKATEPLRRMSKKIKGNRR